LDNIFELEDDFAREEGVKNGAADAVEIVAGGGEDGLAGTEGAIEVGGFPVFAADVVDFGVVFWVAAYVEFPPFTEKKCFGLTRERFRQGLFSPRVLSPSSIYEKEEEKRSSNRGKDQSPYFSCHSPIIL